MAERDELTGPLGALDAGDAGNAEHIALFGASALDQGQGGRFHGDETFGHRHPMGVCLGRHIDHVRLALRVKVGQWAGAGSTVCISRYRVGGRI